jgi:hypothetical protein
MWSMEIAITVPTARDIDHLADIAGILVEELEAAAGEMSPVVSGRFSSQNPVIHVAVDADSEDPVTAVSSTLALIRRVAELAGIPLGDVLAISLNVAEAADMTPQYALA